MEINYPTIEEPATKEYVLSVFRAAHLQEYSSIAAANDEFVGLTFDTNVSDWIDALDLDLMLASEIGGMLNQWWEIDCTAAEWREVLQPANSRRLRDVCELIASRAVRPRVRPANIFGLRCFEAGAFLTVRSLLADNGADVTQLTPTTSLQPYLKKHAKVFSNAIVRLNPDQMPPLRFDHPVYDASCWGMLAGWLAMIAGWLAGWPTFVAAGIVVAVIAYATCWFAARCLPPKSVELGSLRTFRDLAVALVSTKQDRRPRP